jgi:Spy/CpxP family protein refolding chaperone
MRIFRSRAAGLALCVSLAALSASPALFAQDQEPQRGGRGGGMGGGMFMMGGNNAHGQVTAVSGNELTIKDEQGQVYKVETGPNTRIRKDRAEAKISDIHVGDTIVAGGNLDDQTKAVGAVFVMVLTPEQAAQMEKMRADFGKTWTAGKITAIKDLTVTVERPDKTSQTITVDENTTFHKGSRGEATDITFPDVKVGDMLRADGSLKDGSFLATNLVVMEPRQPGQGRFGNRQGTPGSPSQPPPQPQGAPAASPATPQPNAQN